MRWFLRDGERHPWIRTVLQEGRMLMLKKLAKILLRKTRGIDTAARFGAEEFIVILPRTSKANAELVAEKLRDRVEKTNFVGEGAVPGGSLTVCVGAAAYPNDAASPQQLIERADWALYEAKAAGRNTVSAWDESSLAVRNGAASSIKV